MIIKKINLTNHTQTTKQKKKLIIDVDSFLELFNFFIAIKMEYIFILVLILF